MTKSNFNDEGVDSDIVRPGDLLTTRDAAAFLRIKPSTLYKLVHRRKIGCFKPNGKLLYFLRTDLAAWAQQHRQATQQEIERDATTRLRQASAGHP